MDALQDILVEANQFDIDRGKKALCEKYNKDFSILSFGDRINTNHTKYYVSPSDQKELVFTAYMTIEGNLSDNYIEKKQLHKIKTHIKDELMSNNMACEMILSASSETAPNVELADAELEDFLTQCMVKWINAVMIIRRSEFDMEIFKNCMSKIYGQYGIDIFGKVFLPESPEYDICAQKFRERDHMSDSTIRSGKRLKAFQMNVNKKGVDTYEIY